MSLSKIREYSLHWLCATFMLPIAVSNIGLIVFVLSSILLIITKKRIGKEQNITALLSTILISSIFLLYIAYLPFQDKIDVSILQDKLMILILPILLCLTHISKNTFIQLIKTFVISNALLSLILIGKNIFHFINTSELLLFHDFTSLYQIHAVYVSYILFIGIMFCIYFLSIGESFLKFKNPYIFIILLILIFLITLFLCASKNVIITCFLIGLIYFLYSSSLGLKTSFTIISFIILGASVGTISSPKLKNRLAEVTSLSGIEFIQSDSVLTNIEMRKINGTSLRLLLIKFGINIIKENDALLLGVSPYESKEHLTIQYKKRGMEDWFGGYEFHNQYLTYLVEFGLLGLFIYLGAIISLGFNFIKQHNYLALAILMGFVLFQFSETILIRYKGQMLFLFFSFLFLNIFNFERESSNNRN